MPRDHRAFLWDVEKASTDIVAFVEGMSLSDYLSSALVRAAVERKFEIIGEALNGLSRTAPDIASGIGDIRSMIAFRNILIHGYAVIDDRRVFETIRTHLPNLQSAVRRALEQGA